TVGRCRDQEDLVFHVRSPSDVGTASVGPSPMIFAGVALHTDVSPPDKGGGGVLVSAQAVTLGVGVFTEVVQIITGIR
ncbi:hypothetical protein, partial [Streptomyces sp. NPDC056982]|uniref:hypothetical protein n=1 Tax=Streptomyces sp. NPDC056982 TaxID=3345986 RepID=UPI00362CBD8C